MLHSLFWIFNLLLPVPNEEGMKSSTNKTLSTKQTSELLAILHERFELHADRHPDSKWEEVHQKLVVQPEKLWSLYEMERTGGEPDVVDYNPVTGMFLFADCSAESPKGRRSVCYDREGLESRKDFKPEHNAIDWAAAMRIELLNETQYRFLQQKGIFDAKTSSWIHTPASIRKKGGALFGDYRYGQVFIYHNGAGSYYAARGFRGCLEV